MERGWNDSSVYKNKILNADNMILKEGLNL